jgi:hypothetical protein
MESGGAEVQVDEAERGCPLVCLRSDQSGLQGGGEASLCPALTSAIPSDP